MNYDGWIYGRTNTHGRAYLQIFSMRKFGKLIYEIAYISIFYYLAPRF